MIICLFCKKETKISNCIEVSEKYFCNELCYKGYKYEVASIGINRDGVEYLINILEKKSDKIAKDILDELYGAEYE